MTAFSPKQRTVLSWWVPGSPNRDREAIVCDGAVRSGKTLAMGLSFFLWAMSCFSGQKFGVCGKTIASLRRNVLSEILPKLEALGAKWKEKRTDNLLTVKFRGRENQFYVFGGRDESSASLIQGITFAGVLLDEVALMPRSFVEQACARCSVAGSRLWFNCNPAGPGHWFYRTWILEAEKRNCLRLHFTMEDNPSLTPEIRQRYQKLYTGVFYRRFILGQWAQAEGRVYDFFSPEMVGKAPESCEKAGIPDVDAIGILTLTPGETAIIAGDMAVRSADVNVAFLDRFSGTLILYGSVGAVEQALTQVNDMLNRLLQFTICPVTRH